MAFYNSFNHLWNTTVSYLHAPANYCRDNNINWTALSYMADELGFIAVGATQAAAEKVGEAASNAFTSVSSAATDLALGAKASVAQSTYAALQSTHAWHFGTIDKASTEKSSNAMLQELATSAGTQLLDLGHTTLGSTYAALSSKAAELGASAWAGIKVQAPVLGAKLLSGIEYIASQTAALATKGQALLQEPSLDADVYLKLLDAPGQHAETPGLFSDLVAPPTPHSPFHMDMDAYVHMQLAPAQVVAIEHDVVSCDSQSPWEAGTASLVGVVMTAC